MNSAARLALVTIMHSALATSALAGEQRPAEKKSRDPNEVVCEKQEVVGSRLETKEVCMTRAEWAERRRDDREQVERVQLRRCVPTAGC